MLPMLASFTAAILAPDACASVVDWIANPPLRGDEHRGALVDMKTCLSNKACSEAERKLTRKVLALLDPPPRNDEGVKKLVVALAPLLKEATQLRPENFVEQINLLSGGLLLSGTIDAFRAPETAQSLRQWVLDESRALSAKFPKDARALGMIGRAQQETGASDLEALKTYARCLKLDREENLCQQWYRTISARMTSPRCSSGQLVGGFEIKGGTSSRRVPEEAEVTYLDHKIYVRPRPVIGRGDIERLILEEAGGPTVELKASGVKKLTEIASRGKGELAVILIEGRIFSAPPISGPISGNRIKVYWSKPQTDQQARESFAKLCTSVQVPSIPKELLLKP